MKKTAHYFFVSGLFFIIDQLLKYFSRSIWPTQHLLFKYLGWNPFKNYGVAFGLPFPGILIVIFSLLILSLLIYLLFKQQTTSTGKFGMILIVAGATSNLIDRIFFGYTLDYLLILTGVINLADIMIVVGFSLYFFTLRGQTNKN